MKLRVSLINLFPSENKENGVERNTCQKRWKNNAKTNYVEGL